MTESTGIQLRTLMDDLAKSIHSMNDRLTARLDTLDTNVQLSQKSADEATESTNNKLVHLELLLTNANTEQASTHRKLMVVENKLAGAEAAGLKLMARVNYLENGVRFSNLIVDGHPENDPEDLKRFVSSLAMHLTKDHIGEASIVSCYRLGKKFVKVNQDTYTRPRPIKVVFTNVIARNSVYYARTTLKGSELFHGIYISDDVTAETKKERENYRSVAALARADRCPVKMHDDGVILDGVKYKLFESDTLPMKYSLAKAKSVELRGSIYFQSEHAFLSNFYPAPILVDKQLFATAEHRFQYLKCQSAKKKQLLPKILGAKTPLEAKKLGDSLMETPEWRLKRDEAMALTINDKFDQNAELAVLLRETGTLRLCEATRNQYYGVGASLHSREIRDGTHTGQNKLGAILEAKRDRLVALHNMS